MNLIPSPQFLIHHKNKNYAKQIVECDGNKKEIDQMRNQDPLNLILIVLTGSNPKLKKSKLNSLLMLTDLLSTSFPKNALFYGTFSCQENDLSNANYWFKMASEGGNSFAMNAIGLYFLYYHISEEYDSNDLALKWFTRAYNYGSTQALQYMADTYYKMGIHVKAMDLYYSHYLRSNSKYSSFRIAQCLEQLKNLKLSYIWYSFNALNGDSKAVKRLINLENKKDNSVWSNISSDFNLNEQNNEETLSFYKEKDLSLPHIQTSSSIFSLIPPLTNPINDGIHIENSIQTIDYSRMIDPKDIEDKEKQKYIKSISTSSISSPFFPSASKTNLLLLAFKYASPNFNKRNLVLCSIFLRKLYHLHPKGISESVLFRKRCKNGTPKQLVKCGFISMLLYDTRFALQLFLKAAKLGNRTGSLMTGLIFFHGQGINQQIKKGCFFLSQCSSDPIALLHLSIACHDETWENRAKEILSIKSSSKSYEWIGDLFAKGVKIPFNPNVSLVLYGIAMKKAEDDGEEFEEIITKMTKMSLIEYPEQL